MTRCADDHVQLKAWLEGEDKASRHVDIEIY